MSLHHRIRRPRLIQNKVCATLCASLVPLLLLPGSHAARAGSWQTVLTGTNNSTSSIDNVPRTNPNWSLPTPSGPSFSLPAYGVGEMGIAKTTSCNLSLTLKIVLTWTPAAGQTLATDPPPTSIMVAESSSTTWTGSRAGILSNTAANDSLKDPYVVNNGSGGSNYSGTMATAGMDYTPQPVSASGVVTVTRTFTASSTLTAASPASLFVDAALDRYTFSIHAQPYNFRQLGAGIDNGDGTLSWNYVWNSTSGSLADIQPGCTIYEYVSYAGNSTGTHYAGPPSAYAPPHPPVGPASNGKIFAYVDPTVAPYPSVPGGAASAGAMNDIQDKPYSFVGSSSCVAATWTATQTFKFDDTATGQKGVVVPGPGAGPITITRQVYPVGIPPALPQWYYAVNKSGVTSAPVLIP